MATILIIEDNVQNMKLAAFLLNSAGHTVIQASHAQGGIAIARVHRAVTAVAASQYFKQTLL